MQLFKSCQIVAAVFFTAPSLLSAPLPEFFHS